MEQLLNRGSSVSELAYLRMLQLAHSQTSQLVEDLKAFDLPFTSARSALEDSDLRRSLTGSSSAQMSTASATTMGQMLESAMEELFVPYTEGQRYLDRENRSLGSLYSSLLATFTRFHVCDAMHLTRCTR